MEKQVHAIAYPTQSALTNALAPEALEFFPQHLVAGPEWRRVYMILAYPPSADDGWLTAAANLPGVTLSLHAAPQDTTQLVESLNRRIGAIQGQLAMGKNPALTEQRLMQELEDAHALMRQIDLEQQKVFHVAVYLTVAAPDAETGWRRAKRLEGQLGARSMRPRPLLFYQNEGLQASGPFGLWPEPIRGQQIWPAATIAAAWPMGRGGINHGSGILLGHDDEGGVVLIDRWTPPEDAGINNKNFNVLSPPGGGKTFAAIVMLLREWSLGAKIYVLDPEKREYQHACQQVGGDWLNAGGGTTRVNPFQPPMARTMDAQSGLTVLAGHIQWLQTFLTLFMPTLSPIEQALLARATRETYAAKGIALDVDPSTIPNVGWPHIADLYHLCQDHAAQEPDQPGWKVLTALLQEAAVGTLAPLWAGPSTVRYDADADFVVADLMDLQSAPPAVKRAQYFNVLGYLWALIRRDKSERKILVADEAWMLIDPQNPDTLRFLKEVAKVIRGYNGSLMVATQNVYDFLAPAVRMDGEPVLTSAAVNLLLRQDQTNLDYLIHLFNLSDKEQELLSKARRGEGLLIAGNQRVWISVEGAPHEMAFMPPDRPDK